MKESIFKISSHNPKSIRDSVIIVLSMIAMFAVSAYFDLLEKLVSISRQYEHLEIDEIVATVIFIAFALVWFSARRLQETIQANIQLKEKTEQLQSAFKEIKVLQGILPICSYCKKIRDENDNWNDLEEFISDSSNADFTHSICPDCMKKHFPRYTKE